MLKSLSWFLAITQEIDWLVLPKSFERRRTESGNRLNHFSE